VSDPQWASTVDLLKAVLPSLFTALVAAYVVWDGRKRDERRSADEQRRAKDQRRADVIRMGLDRALDRKFELIDRVARGVARYEGLLQYKDRLAVEPTLEGAARLDELTGGWEEWGSYRGAAHELDAELAGACIGLGNLVGGLLLKRPDIEPQTRQLDENRAYDLIQEIWRRLGELRMDVEHQLSPD
jgi:hypothetical protein